MRPHASVSEKIKEYESFLDDKLKAELGRTIERRDKLLETLSQYLALRNQLELIRDSGMKSLKTKINLGSEFYVQANVPDTEFVYVDIGLGFRVQYTIQEAMNFIDKKEAALNASVDKCTRQSAQIKSDIKMVCNAIGELLELQPPSQ
mmetsp:Transcript_32995/g.53534  ORF Transcript_32995/g.53534 Transcript_32995/m.53534 type:complete len:148 (+) Transcript_32995:75-518(+)|eukprot:CAMPEP_0184647392 /NCGR_PEP_ID=MMETSP0308-20130426/4305_1 /TAXON_ID=38269 /ORGANISM="Gloeochaete witrockiana, Strain SAG 46.84" /LENGTH=147 /DNA_ID=CAMNT_0027078299 /DNA_START=46 /DNA_END=489 /DNA_ORIENTATION=-